MAYKPTAEMAEEAQRGLDWRREHGRGGTEVGIARARDISNRRDLSEDTVRRMNSYFARHEVDKEAEGFRPGEDGYPSNGRIAWALWGGDTGQAWAARIVAQLAAEQDRAEPDELKLGDFVRWNTSGGTARGQIEHIMREGVLGIPESEFSINASPDDPAALIRVFRDDEPTEVLVGHRFSALTKIPDIEPPENARPYPNEHAARLTDPAQYDSFARVNDEFGDGIDAIYGIKENEGSELQAIRFDSERFSVEQALAWLDENGYDPIKFEPAIEERAADMNDDLQARHVVDVQETDETVTLVFAKHDMAEDDAPEADQPEIEVEVEAESGGRTDEERKEKPETFHRAAGMDADVVREDDRRVNISISSEKPVERSFGTEILDHRNGSVDLSFLNSGNAPLLLDHDPERQIGVIESVNLDTSARRLRATVRFSKGALGSEVYDDVRDGIRKNVSIGYKIERMERDENAAGGNTYRARAWTPLEVSIVSIPADETVGVGRAATLRNPNETPVIHKEDTMSEDQKMDQSAVEARAREEYAKTVNEILELGASKNKRDLANQAIKDGLTVAQFRGVLAVASADEPINAPEMVGMNANERRNYSLMAALRAQSAGREIGGFEREVSDEIAKRTGKEARGFYVPADIFKRDLTVGTNTAGGFLKPTDHLGNEFVDALRPNLVTANLGARMMSGLSGDVAIPALNAKTAVGFVAENTAPGSEGAPTFRQITMAPKTIAQYVDLSRKLMMQSDPSVEQIIRDDMLRQFAAKIDEVAIEGGGTNEPTGITQTSGIGSVAIGTNGGPITYASLVDLESEVAIDNALGGRLAYLTNPKVVGAMRQTARQASGVEGNFILNDSNTILGYNVASSTLVPSDLTKGTSSGVCSAVIFGNFADLMIGMFGGLDVLVDPYTGSATGATRVSMFQDVDVAVRHAESFAAILDVTT